MSTAPPLVVPTLLKGVRLVVCLGLLGVGAAQAATLRILAPSAPGSGWDVIARAIKEGADQRRAESSREVEVVNLPGAGGLVGLGDFSNRASDADLLVTGLTMLDAALVKHAPVSIERLTPIARLCAEPYAVIVPDASPFRSLDDLRTTLLADPPKMAWAGGPNGSTDHVATVLLARALGIETTALNYVAFLGTSDAIAATAEGGVAAAFAPLTEAIAGLKAGKLRLLAVAAEQAARDVTAPTLRDSGVDLAFANWRGVVARADISMDERAALTDLVSDIARSPEWQAAIAARGWQPAFLPGDDFARFVLAERGRLERALKTLGFDRRTAN